MQSAAWDQENRACKSTAISPQSPVLFSSASLQTRPRREFLIFWKYKIARVVSMASGQFLLITCPKDGSDGVRYLYYFLIDRVIISCLINKFFSSGDCVEFRLFDLLADTDHIDQNTLLLFPVHFQSFITWCKTCRHVFVVNLELILESSSFGHKFFCVSRFTISDHNDNFRDIFASTFGK